MKKNHKLLYVFLISGWIVAAVCLFFIFKNAGSIKANRSFSHQEKQYPLLSKRILNEFPNDILINFLDLRKNLREQTTPYGDTFGFYFEYLPTGVSIGVNEKNEFYAASLFKVPVIMAYYKFLERIGSKEDLSNEYIIDDQVLDTQFGDLWKKGIGEKVKMSDAIKLALEKSDNTAAKIIALKVNQDDFDSVYEALDIELETATGGAILTTKNYTSILKALYFSAVLKKDDSNEILNYLANSPFNDKLVAGVPKNVKVSHKIGEYIDDSGNKAFMDCGIIYAPRRPYSLCMISTTDEETANKRMELLSKTVYEYVTAK